MLGKGTFGMTASGHMAIKLVGIVALGLGLLSACGAYQGNWPRLAPKKPEDVAFQREGALEEAADQSDVSETPQVQKQATAADVEKLAPLKTRTTQIRAAFNTLIQRYETQKEKVEEARHNTRSGRLGPSSSDWTTTQLELTRLGQITREMEDVRVQAAKGTADVAALSTQGVKVEAVLTNLGQLIGDIDKALETAELYRKEVSMSLSDAPRP